MSEKKLPIEQDPDYMSSYADGVFLKLDNETSTVRLVFYKNEVKVIEDKQTSLPDDLIKNLIFEVRLPNSALTGLLDIAYRFNRYREELAKNEELSDKEIEESFGRFTETLSKNTFDTSDPEEHDKELNARFMYYLSKLEKKGIRNETNEEQSS